MHMKYQIAKTSEVSEGSMKSYLVNGKRIALVCFADNYYAIADTCTHEHCSLSGEGFLEGATITCGCHGAQFDATNGNVLSLPATVSLASYKTVVEGDVIYIVI